MDETLRGAFPRVDTTMIRLIAAIDKRRGIGDEHGIPWQGRLPTDTKYFRERTSEGTILMGYRTYEEFSSPLHDRENFVIVRPETADLRPGFIAVAELIPFLRQRANEVVWVVGGAAVFGASLPLADELFVTQLDSDFHCSRFFPRFEDDFALASVVGRHVENDIAFQFEIWRRKLAPSEG